MAQRHKLASFKSSKQLSPPPSSLVRQGTAGSICGEQTADRQSRTRHRALSGLPIILRCCNAVCSL